MRFKTQQIRWHLSKLTPECLQLASLFNLFSWIQFEKKALVTSILRPENKKSVHAHGRGIDFRSTVYTEKEKKLILGFFDQFVYDPKRPKMKVLLLEDDPEHFHLQTFS